MWDAQRFEEKASELAKSGKNIKDSIKKVAEQENFNVQQIERLTRLTNVKVFNDLYEKRAGKDDRIVEFDVVDPNDIINELRVSENQKTASEINAAYPNLTDEYAPPPIIKQDNFLEKKAEEIKVALGKELPLATKIARLESQLENLEIEKFNYTHNWENNMQSLVKKARELYFDYNEFEKNAVAFFGSEILPEINAIRSELKMPGLEINEEKLASVLDQLIKEETPETTLLKVALDNRKDYLECLSNISKVKETLNQKYKEIKNAH